jgi:hypothetical protein
VVPCSQLLYIQSSHLLTVVVKVDEVVIVTVATMSNSGVGGIPSLLDGDVTETSVVYFQYFWDRILCTTCMQTQPAVTDGNELDLEMCHDHIVKVVFPISNNRPCQSKLTTL